jgi:MFS transporter, DHA1 family, multidrug resistance protein
VKNDVSVDQQIEPVEGAMKFRVFAAMAMAASALSIDSILPAFSKIRSELGLAEGSSATAGLITAFFIGLALGQIPIGLLADRYGRRPVLWLSAGVFLLGIGGMSLSTSLAAMMASRFVWGLGAAGLRTAALAMIRDRFVGARMAREMSFVMAVFLIVPIFAPVLGAAILKAFSWRMVLALSAAFGIILCALTFAIPETLDRTTRQPLRVSQIAVAARAIVANRTTLRYSLLLTAIFGVFSSYLASSERMVGDIFDRKSQFPVLFGVVGVAMGALSIVVGRRVERIGLVKVIRVAVGAYLTVGVLTFVISLTGQGVPSFWPFWIVLTGLLALHNIVFPNVNSAAMIPLGQIAGTAGAVIGTVSTAGGAIVGAIIDTAFDGTVRPLSFSFMLSGIIAAALALPIRKLSN